MSIRFTKMHGAGNDFVVLDGRETGLWRDAAALARLGDRRRGIGCEGFLVLLPPDGPGADIRLDFFNPDGSAAELCGNGTRCAALFARVHGWTHGRAMRIATGAGTVEAEVLRDDPRDGLVRLRLQPASIPEPRHVILSDGSSLDCLLVNSGVPHAVAFVPDASAVDVDRLGRELRFHAAFAPAGANVDFVERTGPSSLFLRTYERGVEAESGACGTGAVASAVAFARAFPDAGFPADIRVSSGDILTVDPRDPQGPLLTGPACEVFDGILPDNPFGAAESPAARSSPEPLP